MNKHRSGPKQTRGTRRNANPKAGFTLIELISSFAIIALGILGSVSTFASCNRLQQTTREYESACLAARASIEALRSGDLDARVADAKERCSDPDAGGNTATSVTITFPDRVLEDALGTLPGDLKYLDLDGDRQIDLNVASTEEGSLVPVQVVVSVGSVQTRFTTVVTQK